MPRQWTPVVCGAPERYHRVPGKSANSAQGGIHPARAITAVRGVGLRSGPRIISGKWRRRRLRHCAGGAARPTPDRVKETLFNWLGSRVEGAACLDLFAGSGSLGFEAASRGAASVTMVEIDAALVSHLRSESERLGAVGIEIVRGDALQWLLRAERRFDIVFLDPPFSTPLLERSCRRLSESGCLACDALLYLECERARASPPLPEGFELWRAGRAGEVRYHLARRRPCRTPDH